MLRRIIRRSVIRFCRPKIQLGCGTLQNFCRDNSGVEASIHAMKEIFDSDDCEAAMLVDADNAFNRLNRAAALENIQHTCPALATYFWNTYSTPSQLFLSGGKCILSQEGTTQGDNGASTIYSLSTKPLVNKLKGGNCANKFCSLTMLHLVGNC